MREAIKEVKPLPSNPTVFELTSHRRFHATVYSASHNDLLISTLESLWDKADRYRRLGLEVSRTQEELEEKDREHHQLLDAVVSGDSEGAAAVMLRHITTSLGAKAASCVAGRPGRQLRRGSPPARSAERARDRPVRGATRHAHRGRAHGHLGSVVSQQALVANRTPRLRYDTAFGHYTFAASAGQAVGPALIVAFGGAGAIPHTSAIFVCAAVLSGVLLAVTFAMPQGPGRNAAQVRATGSTRDLLRRSGLTRALLVSCIVLAAVDISLVYLPVLGADRDIAAGTIGLLLSVRAAASMASGSAPGSHSPCPGSPSPPQRAFGEEPCP